MKKKLSAWKCISISNRERRSCRSTAFPHHASCRQDARRTLKVEVLAPREMLAADLSQQPDTHFAENGSVPAEVSNLIGDINGDGDLTSLDGLAVLNAINDPISFPATLAMDLNHNEIVDLEDYRLVFAAVHSHNFNVNGYQSQSGVSSESMGGTTQVSSMCDADAALLASLQSQLATLQSQLANTTLPSQIATLHELIAGVNNSIAQVQSRMDDCDVYGGGGDDDGGGTTAGDLGDPYGSDPNTGNGSSMGTTMGTTYDPQEGGSDPYSGGSDPYGGVDDPYVGTGGTIAATGGTNASGSSSGSGAESTAGSTTGWTSGTDGSSYSGTAGSSGDGTSGTMAGSGFGTSAGATSGTTPGTTTPDTTSGSTPDGSTAGSTSGSSGESTSGSTEPTAFKIAGLRAGMFTGALDGIESPRAVREGQQLRVAGWVSGPWSERPAPSLTVLADINFDGDFADDGEGVLFKSGEYLARTRNHGPDDHYSGFDAYFSLLDDGESDFENGVPGNDTPSDEIDIRIEFTGDEPEISQSVHNVNPLFTARPSVNVETTADGSKLLSVTSSLWDPGRWDRHHVTVKWADGTTSEATDESSSFDPLTHEFRPTDQKSIQVTRPMPAAGLSLYPITVTIHDDDRGETSYLIRSANVSRNNDDDNENTIDDMFDSGFAADDDVAQLSLSAMTSAYAAATNPPAEELPAGGDPSNGGDPSVPPVQEPPEPEGYYYLGYDTSQINLWDSREKIFQYTPGGQKHAANPYNGQSDVWIEGIGIGATRITLSWQPNYEEDNSFDWDQERNILLGHIDVTVWGIDVDIDSDNNNGFNYPDNSEWEEELEGDKYGLGKLVYPDDPQFVPLRLRLPPGLDPEMPATAVSFDFDTVGQSGVIYLWNAAKNAARTNTNIHNGGNRIFENNSYSLKNLNYDSGTGGLASAAALVGNIRADTFNSAGLMESTLFTRDANGVRVNNVEQYPGSLVRYHNASGLIDAYYLDWDILSFVQDYSPGIIPSALGTRYNTDGPLDAQMAGISVAFLASKLIPGAGWVNIVSELGQSAYYMGLAHKTLYYHYGLMVDESTGWDIYGYDL